MLEFIFSVRYWWIYLSWWSPNWQVMGAYFEKIGSKSFAVYSIAVTDAQNKTWFVKRRCVQYPTLNFCTQYWFMLVQIYFTLPLYWKLNVTAVLLCLIPNIGCEEGFWYVKVVPSWCRLELLIFCRVLILFWFCLACVLPLLTLLVQKHLRISCCHQLCLILSI